MIPGRLVFLHSSDELYGADRVLLDILEALPDRSAAQVWLPTDQPRHQLCHELRRRGVDHRHLDLPILRRAYRNASGLAALAVRAVRLVLALRAARPDVVYCTTSAALPAAPAARLAGTPTVLGHVQEVWSAGDRGVLGRLAAACHGLIAVSSTAADALGPRLRPRCTVVPNCTPEPASRASLAGRDGPLSFVVASRWGPGKGYATLLGAWDALDRPGHLTVLGGPPPVGASVDVRALVAALRDPASVSVVGEVDDPGPYLEAADVVLVPSDYPEGFGLVAVEAFARGRPAVVSSAGALTEIVTDGVDGWVFTPGDSVALARILGQLDRAGVTRAGERARNTYEQRYTSAAFSQRWSDAFRRAGRARPDGDRAAPAVPSW